MTLPWQCGDFSDEHSGHARYGPAKRAPDPVVAPLAGADATIVARLREGDPATFETLYRQSHKRLWRIALAFVHRQDDAEEIVQNVFVRLWETRTSLRISAGVESYLYGAVRNESLRFLRHARVVDRAARTFAGDLTPVTSAPDARADRQVEQTEADERLRRAMATLPERRRIALTLRWGEELSYRDIGALLGVSEQAAQMLVARAKRDLQAILGSP